MSEILTGTKAHSTCRAILASEIDGVYPAHEGSLGYYRDGDSVVAFDNQDCCCWVEEFKTVRAAIRWLTGKD